MIALPDHLPAASGQASAGGHTSDAVSSRPSRVLWFLAGLAVVVPPVVAALTFRDARSAVITGAVLLPVISPTRSRRWSWAWVASAALVVALAVSPGLGLWVAASTIMVLLLVALADASSAPTGNLTGILPGLLVLASLTVWRAWAGAWWGVVWLVGATLVLVVVGSRRPSMLATIVARVRYLVGSALGRLLFGILYVPLVLVPWVLDRVARVDALWSPMEWAPVRDARVRSDVPWNNEARRLPTPHRVRRAAVGLVGVALVWGAFVSWPDTTTESVPAAFAGADWYPEYLQDINWVWSTDVAFDPLAPLRVRDVRTRYVNVVDGRRLTWSPPPCGACDRLQVWVYGGSTTFGLGQRDSHTVPSELARAAWRDGYVLDVDNRGVPGDAHWEEAQRFAWDLANEPPPDLVVFYDGVNEMRSLEFVTEGAPRPVSFVKENFWKQYLELTGETGTSIAESLVGRRPQGRPSGARRYPRPPRPELDASGWGELAVERYDDSRRTTRALAESYGVPVRYFWQPGLEHRDEMAGEPDMPGRHFAGDRAAAASAALSDDVTDLSAVFEGVREPIFYDSNHTNELGSKLVGERLFGEIEPDLARLRSVAGEEADP